MTRNKKKRRKVNKSQTDKKPSSSTYSTPEKMNHWIVPIFIAVFAVFITIITYTLTTLVSPVAVMQERFIQINNKNKILERQCENLRQKISDMESRIIRLEVQIANLHNQSGTINTSNTPIRHHKQQNKPPSKVRSSSLISAQSDKSNIRDNN